MMPSTMQPAMTSIKARIEAASFSARAIRRGGSMETAITSSRLPSILRVVFSLIDFTDISFLDKAII